MKQPIPQYNRSDIFIRRTVFAVSKTLCKVIGIIVITAVLFSACSSHGEQVPMTNNNDDPNSSSQPEKGNDRGQSGQITNGIVGTNRPICGHGGKDAVRQTVVPEVQELTHPLEGEIKVLSSGITNGGLGIYAELFEDVYPNVKISIETSPPPDDMAQTAALMTRLQSAPPDIFVFFPGSVNFEKFNMDAMFTDLYGLFDGSRGIDESDYFANIFRASEMRGGLYYLPIHIHYDITLLNKRLLEGISVDASEITSLTVDELIDLCIRVDEAFPEEKTYINDMFSMYEALIKEPMYDVETGAVFVNTTEMKERLERAVQIPFNDKVVVFTPEGLMYHTTSSNQEAMTRFTSQRDKNLITSIYEGDGLRLLAGLFIQDHIPTTLSQPVTLMSGCAHYGFSSITNLSIMKDASRSDLAWEFIRFIMEYEGDLFDRGMSEYTMPMISFPINRARFDNQVSGVVTLVADEAYTFSRVKDIVANSLEGRIEAIMEENSARFKEENLSPGQQRVEASYMAQQELLKPEIDKVMGYLRENMESLSYEIRTNYTVISSLVYPDVWLLHSGQQDVAQALASIQSKLELYVNE